MFSVVQNLLASHFPVFLTQITMLVSGAKGECVVAGGEVNKFQALL
jgi:hypothetical protein